MEIGRGVARLGRGFVVMAVAANAHWQEPGGADAMKTAPTQPLISTIADLASGLGNPSELKCCSKAEDAKSGSQSRCMTDLTVLPGSIAVRSAVAHERPDAGTAVCLHGLTAASLLHPPINA